MELYTVLTYVSISLFIAVCGGLTVKLLYDGITGKKTIATNGNVNGNGNGRIMKMLDHVVKKVDDIFKMHDKHDEDGTPLWFMPRSWSKTLTSLRENTIKQNLLIEQMNTSTLEQNRLLSQIVSELRSNGDKLDDIKRS